MFIERCQDPFLPDEILWRQKEQFSDGVGYGWIDHIKSTAEAAVSDVNFEARQHRFPHNTPHTKEAYVPLAGTTLCWAMRKCVECVCLGSGTGSLRRDGRGRDHNHNHNRDRSEPVVKFTKSRKLPRQFFFDYCRYEIYSMVPFRAPDWSPGLYVGLGSFFETTASEGMPA